MSGSSGWHRDYVDEILNTPELNLERFIAPIQRARVRGLASGDATGAHASRPQWMWSQ
jgi:hypothetical protein